MTGGQISWGRRGASKPWGSRCAEGKVERELHRRLVPTPSAPRPETLICWGRHGLGAEAQAQRSDLGSVLGLLCGNSSRGLESGVPQPRVCWRSLGPPGQQGTIAGECKRMVGRAAIGTSFSMCMGSQAGGHLLAQAMGVGTSHSRHLRLQK